MIVCLFVRSSGGVVDAMSVPGRFVRPLPLVKIDVRCLSEVEEVSGLLHGRHDV
jgi:hypothetical protein